MTKNLIVGMLVSLGWWEVEPFIVSLKKNCEPCDLMLEVFDEMSEWTLDRVRKESDESLNIIIKRVPSEFKDKYISYARFKMIDDFIEEHKGEYRQVLMSDVRDVIFQGDPFKEYADRDSYLVYATEWRKIGNEPTNTSWIMRDHGKEVFEQIKDKTIACAGTLMGTADEMQIALRELNKYLVLDKFNVHGADQALLNYLIHTDKMPVDNLIENSIEKGVICTNGWHATPIVDDKILALGGKHIPPVVHQYERHASGKQLADRLYRTHEVVIDKNYDDFRSKLDIADALIRCDKLAEVLTYLAQIVEVDTSDWKAESKRAMKLFKSFSSKPQSSFNASLTAQLLCQVFMRLLTHKAVKDVNSIVVNMMYKMTSFAKQSSTTNLKNFNILLGTLTFKMAKMMEQNSDRKQLTSFLDMIKQLEYPLNSEYYLMSAKNNRLLGNKEQAIEDYKKSFD